MALKLQKRPPRRSSASGPAAASLELLTELQDATEELANEVKCLKTEFTELRLGLQSMDRRVEALQTESAALQKQVNQVGMALAGLGDQLATMADAFQHGLQALSATTHALETQQTQAATRTAELGAVLQDQAHEQAKLAAALAAGQQAIVDQLRQLGERTTISHTVQLEQANLARETFQRLKATFAEGLGKMTGTLAELAQTERQNVSRLETRLAAVTEAEQACSSLLLAVDTTVRQVGEHAAQVLKLHREEEAERDFREATHWNALGLRCLSEGNTAAATDHFQRARALAPEAFEPRFNLLMARLVGDPATWPAAEMAELCERFPGRRELEQIQKLATLRTRAETVWRDLARAMPADKNVERVEVTP